MKKINIVWLALVFLPSCVKDTTPEENIYNTRGIAAAINNNFNLTLFSISVQTTGNTALLTEQGPFTVFAPTNIAFTEFGLGTPQLVTDAAATLLPMITYHIYEPSLRPDSLPLGFNQEFKMKNRIPVYISRWQNERDSAVTVNGVRVEGKGLETTNGFIYVLDKVLRPAANNIKEVIAGDQRLTFFNAAMQRSGLEAIFTTPGKHTVFAPVNDAFINIGITTTDSIYHMEPATLQNMLQSHIATEGRFIYDYIARADIASDRYTETMLDNSVMQVVLQPNYNRPGRFTGASLQKDLPDGSIRTAIMLTADVAAANGVVHIIDNILTP